MTHPLLPAAIPSALKELHRDVPEGVFDDAFRSACLVMDRYVGALANELANELSLPVGEPFDADDLLGANGWNPAGRLALRWLLGTLELYGAAERAGSKWRFLGGTPATRSDELAELARSERPAVEPAYRVLRTAARALPAVLRGEVRGEDALFNPSTLGLWFEYFSNDNPHYGPNNAICAVAVARAAPAGAAILEVGGGGGSGAQAVLGELTRIGRPPTRYVFTELHPAFLRRGSRAVQAALPAGCSLETKKLDIDLDPTEQGIDEGAFDIVFGVNTLHLARRLVPTLARLGGLLRSDGALVLGEVMRPAVTNTVHLELPFALLEGYAHAETDDEIRPQPGFLTTSQWLKALAAAGYTSVTMLPAAIDRCAELYPGFYAGAITGRRG